MKFDKDDYKQRILEEYNQKIVNFGNGMIEVTVYHNHQIRQLGSLKHKGGATNKSEISDEAQEERRKNKATLSNVKYEGMH